MADPANHADNIPSRPLRQSGVIQFPDSAVDKRFAISPAQVLADPDLSGNDKTAYAVLAMHANRRSRRCWPSIEALMKASAMQRRTLLRSIANLERLGYILRERRPNRVTRYVVLVGKCPDCSNMLHQHDDHCVACGWDGVSYLTPEVSPVSPGTDQWNRSRPSGRGSNG